MKKIKITILFLLIIVITGCTSPLRNEDNQTLKYEKTGQNITENILCKPTDKEVIKIYEENDVNIENLPNCTEFSINEGGYEGLWTSLFVKPLAWLILIIGKIFNNYGISLIIVGILIRFLVFPITKGTAMQSEALKKAQPELKILEEKYKGKNNQEEMMKKSQEMMKIYKKYNINPLSSCLFAFLQLPIFFAFLEAVNRVPAIFEEKFLFLQLGTTPLVAIGKGQYQYLILVIILIWITYYSFKLNKTAPINIDAKKQMDLMSKIMIGFISIISFNLSTAISIYWITSSSFTVFQNLVVKKRSK